MYLLTFASKSSTKSMNSLHIKPRKKFDSTIREFKVNPRSSFEYSWVKIYKTSIKSYFLAFSHFWSCRNKGQDTLGLCLNNFGVTQVLDATYHISTPSVHWFQRRILKLFINYWHSRYVGHVRWTIWTNFCSLSPTQLYIKFDYNWPSSFWDIWNCHTKRVRVKSQEWLWPQLLTSLRILVSTIEYKVFRPKFQNFP